MVSTDYIDRKEFERRHSEVIVAIAKLETATTVNANNITSLDKQFAEKITVQETARAKSEEVLNERLANMNRFREENLADRSNYATKEYVDLKFEKLNQTKSTSTEHWLTAIAIIVAGLEALIIALK